RLPLEPSRPPVPARSTPRRLNRADGTAESLLVVFLVVDELVRILRAARDTPQLGLVDHLVRRRRVPRLGRDVDAPDEDELLVGIGAVLADARRHAPHLRRPR